MMKHARTVNTTIQEIVLASALVFSGNSFALGVKGYDSYRQTMQMRDVYKKKALRFAETALHNARTGLTDQTIDFIVQARENSRFVISDFTGATSQKIHVRLRQAVVAIKKNQIDKAVNYLEEAVKYLRKIQ
ncbi:MAG TPA: hypothetical protein ENJ32_09680 [Crenotrichaceae bacterium]|nr:hypothetical protein [Crenotrichaceae bacterium]